MAKFDLKFIDNYQDDVSISVRKETIELYSYDEDIINVILSYKGGNTHNIRLDKSTAIKFAKTLRTEINKIQ